MSVKKKYNLDFQNVINSFNLRRREQHDKLGGIFRATNDATAITWYNQPMGANLCRYQGVEPRKTLVGVVT